jgi:hypothetical protein
MIIDNDVDAWNKYPQHRKYFNKLWLSEKLGYCCGPGGIPVPSAGYYIVRPIYNLRGMGLNASIQQLSPSDLSSVPPGYFWCEQFKGNQYSIDYTWQNNKWEQISAMQGINNQNQLYKFSKWIKTNKEIDLPLLLNCLSDCEYINVEFIEDKIIEIHLRVSPDPTSYQELIPVWQGDTVNIPPGYIWIESKDDADHLLPQSRLGFYAK